MTTEADDMNGARCEVLELFDIHEGIDLNLRWGAAIVDLMTTGDVADENVRVAADAACNYLREAKRNVDLLHAWYVHNRKVTNELG